jgi:transglutaminase-like putative cysteine protease
VPESLPDGSRPAIPESPENFLGSSPLLDLQDSRLRLRAGSLTQLWTTDRGKAMAIYNHVKKLPYERRYKFGLRTAREVLDAGGGDAFEKAVLLVALLRCVRLPARLRFVELRGEILRGLTSGVATTSRPVAEVWLDGRWVRTDSYIYDGAYMAAARQRLKDHDWEWGYGIHRNGQSVWNGSDDAFLGSYPTEADPMVVAVAGVFDDPLQFMRSDFFRRKHRPIARALQWNVLAVRMRSVMRQLRKEAAPQPRSSRRPS